MDATPGHMTQGRMSMDPSGYSPFGGAGYASPHRSGKSQYMAEGLGMSLVEELEPKCSLWRYRCPVSEIRELDSVNSKYSDEFSVAGVPWRMHLQQRTDQQNGVVYLAVHLQCVSTHANGTYGHFKISVNNRDAEKSKGKNFHCHFKKAGSAWGLHHFIQIERLLNSEVGFIERFEVAPGQIIPCVSIEILLKVIDPGVDGTYVFGQLPKPSKSSSSKPKINARLQWPAEEHTDMQFSLSSGEVIRAHKCIISTRCPKFFQDDAEVDSIALEKTNKVVFELFLRYVYSEEVPEGRLEPETLIEVYQLAAEHGFVNLAKKCLELVQPLITGRNVLDMIASPTVLEVLTDPEDSPLQLIFLRVLTTNYDDLIQDFRFETIPGKVHRKLSLIMRSKADLGEIAFNSAIVERTLSQDLNALAKSGSYSDMEVILPGGASMPLHKVVLMNRATLTQHWEGAAYQFPGEEQYSFDDDTYRHFFESMYRGTIESEEGDAVTPELITLTLKMDSELGLNNPELKRECDAYVTAQNCLELYVLSVKHEVQALTDTSKVLLAKNFLDKVRHQPDQVWRLVDELPRHGLLELFRGHTSHLLQQ
eukprot:TRINITY_DN12232_c0_g1_i1.p2 TRINITY_DN12232_c0_g1~~TRINITY_DN12232_c0_g1_i1.p2  ORF type:complete len:592 (+),score=268.61 TRINITY_DN12232_c0_g1_i1:58-1833(+)